MKEELKAKDRVRPILEKLGIKPTDCWTIKEWSFGFGDRCYYYLFEVNGTQYRVWGNSFEFALTDENPFNYLYKGLEAEQLENTLRRVIQQ